MKFIKRFVSIPFGIFLAILVLSGCRYPSTPFPVTKPNSLPATPQASPADLTPTGIALPLVMQNQPEISPSPTLAGTARLTLTPASLPTLDATPIPPPDITLLFSGVIVPARCVQSSIDARGDANYVYDEVREVISGADLAVGTLNTTFSDLSTHTGCIVTYVLVSDSRSAAAAAAAGFDVMSVATNHIKNCAGASCEENYNRAFLDTLDNLRANNILPVGGGGNLAEALQPVVVEVKGIRFGIVSLGMVEPMAFAGEDSPGIAPLADENLRSAIAEAKKTSDVVIAMPHWGPEDSPDPNEYQLHYAAQAVQDGADVVVGNHTHVVQAIQDLNGVDVFYGLGNFVFDQNWDLAHMQGVMLVLHFSGKHYTGYELIPTHVDFDGTVHIAGSDEAAQILQRIEDASARLR